MAGKKGFESLKEGGKAVGEGAKAVAGVVPGVVGGAAGGGAKIASGTTGAAAGIFGRVLQAIGGIAKKYPKASLLIGGYAVAKTIQNKLRKRKEEQAEAQPQATAQGAAPQQEYPGYAAPEEFSPHASPAAPAQEPSPQQQAAMLEQLMAAASQAQSAGVQKGDPSMADPSATMDGNWAEQAEREQQLAANKEQTR